MADTMSQAETPSSGPEPSVSAAPESGAAPHQKQQGADRPKETPSSSDGSKALKEPELPKDYKPDPNDHSGEPLKMHDGSGDAPKKPEAERKKSEAGTEGGGPMKGKGTGELYEKSTGLEADGGDFDATRPGAGKEATRLLEEKGIHHEVGAPKPPVDGPAGGADKPSVGDKIKGALHVGGK